MGRTGAYTSAVMTSRSIPDRIRRLFAQHLDPVRGEVDRGPRPVRRLEDDLDRVDEASAILQGLGGEVWAGDVVQVETSDPEFWNARTFEPTYRIESVCLAEVGDATGVPIMLHWTVEPDVLALLKKGDILAHPFNPPESNQANLFGSDKQQAEKILPQILARPRWLYGFFSDGGLMSFPNVMLPEGPMKYAEVGAALEAAAVCWADLKWIREAWAGPIVVKGVHTADDARRALDEGARAVIVSNHGGRQLDGVAPTLRVLPEVVAAVGDRTEVLFDGGVRRGTPRVLGQGTRDPSQCRAGPAGESARRWPNDQAQQRRPR